MSVLLITLGTFALVLMLARVHLPLGAAILAGSAFMGLMLGLDGASDLVRRYNPAGFFSSFRYHTASSFVRPDARKWTIGRDRFPISCRASPSGGDYGGDDANWF